MVDHRILAGDIISVAGLFRDGTMDEHRQNISENVQVWRVATNGGTKLIPVLPSGEPDVESYWFGRSTGIVNKHGRYGIISEPTHAGRN